MKIINTRKSIFVLFLLLVQTLSFPVIAANESFSPSLCKSGDKRFVYWAAGDQVFKFKYNPSIPLQSLPREAAEVNLNAAKEIPPPPDPTQPAGCYKNPLRAGQVPYMQNFDETLSRRTIGRNIDSMTPRFGFTTGYFATSREKKYRPSTVNLMLYKKSQLCWERHVGIEECTLSKSIDKNDYRIGRVLKINKSLLSTHVTVNDLYLSIYTDTQSAISMDNGLVLDGSTDIFGSVRLISSFRIFPKEIDALVPYYQELIAYLVTAHIPNYQWAPSTKVQQSNRRN